MYPRSSKVGTPRVPHQDDIQELIDVAIMINRGKTSQSSSEEISAAIAALVNSAPGTLDTLGELASALEAGDTAATALFNSVATKTTLAAASAAAAVLIASQHTSDSGTYAHKVSMVVDAAGGGDYTTIQSAMAAVPGAGADVLVKRGTYTIATQIVVPSNVTLRGEGDGTLIFVEAAFAGNPAVNVSGADATVKDLRIDGNKVNQVSNVTTLDFVAGRGKALNVHVTGANGYGIHGGPGGTDLLFQGCTSEDCRDENFEFQGVVRGVIANNICRGAGANGIYVWGNTAGGGTCSDVTVTGNQVYNSSQRAPSSAGIRVDDGATNVTVSGNTVSGGGTTSPGIVVSSSSAVLCNNVTVSGNTINAPTGCGIYVAKSNYVAVVGNTLRNAASVAGIKIDSNAVNCTVSGNTVSGTVSAYGIDIRGPKATITGNVSSGNGIAGILASGTTDAAINGNTCNSNTQNGIEVSSTTGGSVSNNTCVSNGTSYNGIIIGSSSGLAVTGNECNLSGRSGIRVDDSSNLTITGNVCKNGGAGGSVALSAGISINKGAGTCAGHLIANNRCHDDQGTKKQYYGLRVIGAVDNCIIGPNLFSGGAVGGGDAYVDATATNISGIPCRKVAATVGATQTTIAHGLPYIPIAIDLMMTSAGTIWKSAPCDATNVYLTADAAARTCDLFTG